MSGQPKPPGYATDTYMYTSRPVGVASHPGGGGGGGSELGWVEHYTGYGWAVYIMAETRSLAPIAVDG